MYWKIFFSLVIMLMFYSVQAKAQLYYVFVAAESQDEINLISFDAESGKSSLARADEVGLYPTEIDGPHGLNMSLDKKYLFVTIAHGNPFGTLQKLDAATGKIVGQTQLGLFPASMEVSPATGFLYVVNFNLHGDMIPSTFSVVDTESLDVLAEVETGIMPHGSRVSTDGRKYYHVSMMTDELIEVDALSFEITKRFMLSHKSHHSETMEHSDMNMNSERGMNATDMAGMKHKPKAKPTWVDPHPTKSLVYVAHNGENVISEIDTETWKILRRFETGKGPYNLEVSPDGRLLVASYKSSGETGIWNLKEGRELARLKNTRMVTHGVTISPDSKFAFVSVEGVGGEPGSVDIIDLTSHQIVGQVDTGKQAGGIIFWKMLPGTK